MRVARFFMKPDGTSWLLLPIPNGSDIDAAGIWSQVKTQGCAVSKNWVLPIEMIAYMVVDEMVEPPQQMWSELPGERRPN
jgi:hypothetical protein